MRNAKLLSTMIAYDRGDVRRIQHFIKVHDFASLIGNMEKLDDDNLIILEAAAIVHDIGIHICEEKYGVCDGKHQEIEGPTEAKKLLNNVGGYTDKQIERICWLVGHHHTYKNVVGEDYQILIEADFLVNIYEDNLSSDAIEKIKKNIFKTKAGIKVLEDMYELS